MGGTKVEENKLDLSDVDTFYAAIMEHKDKLKKVQEDIDAFEKLGDNKYAEYDEDTILALESLDTKTENQEKMIAEYRDWQAKKGEYEKLLQTEQQEVAFLAGSVKGIRTALSQYMKNANQKIDEIKKQRDSYATYIEEEKAEVEKLEQRLASTNDDALKAEISHDLAYKKRQMARREKKLESLEQDIVEYNAQIEQVKTKYAKYIEMSKEDLDTIEPEEKEAGKEKAGEEKEKKNPDDKEEKTENGNKEKTSDEEEKSEKSDENKDTDTFDIEDDVDKKTPFDKKAPTPSNERTTGGEQNINSGTEEVTEPKKPETDKEAYTRITELLNNKDTRYKISDKDKDRIISILSNPDNYDALKIKTHRIFGLSSQSDKVFKNLGKVMAKDIDAAGVPADHKFLKKQFTKKSYRDAYSLSDNSDKEMYAEKVLSEAIGKAKTDARVEDLANLKARIAKFRGAFTTQFLVGAVGRGDMGDIAYRMAKNSNMLPVGKTDPSSITAPEEPKKSGLDLSDMVNTPEQVVEYDSQQTDEQAITNNEPEKGGFVIED